MLLRQEIERASSRYLPDNSNAGTIHRIVRNIVSGDGFLVRTMDRREVGTAVDWAGGQEGGWNPGGVHDAEAFYAADPGGFFVAELDGGEPIGSVSVVNYGETFAFAGLYILKPGYRNRGGYGSRLFAAGMAHAGDRNVGGDGVVEMQEKYRTRSGFRFAYRNIRFEGTGGGSEPEGPADLAEVPFERLSAYDARHFPAPRPRVPVILDPAGGGDVGPCRSRGRRRYQGGIRRHPEVPERLQNRAALCGDAGNCGGDLPCSLRAGTGRAGLPGYAGAERRRRGARPPARDVARLRDGGGSTRRRSPPISLSVRSSA